MISARSLGTLQAEIVRCRMCPRLVAWREEVARKKVRRYRDEEYWGKPIPGFGDPEARLVLVGLAPAAHGGNRTGRVFTGDRSGDWLYGALYAFGFANQPTSRHRGDGLALEDAFVTAAVRCAPPANKPTRQEMDACRPYLVRELALLRRARVVVALGKVAFDSYLRVRRELGREAARPLPRFGHGKTYRMPEGVTIIASFHPSQQNTQTGRLTRAMFHAVFRKARRLLEG
ncbi:MAG TPA: uracil-DNA glycosylase [Candidatus Sulfotelmatobacter sp.]|nr:uracil-DNA glycosylase [Candidatus Sulfotelmatobacter sp.]